MARRYVGRRALPCDHDAMLKLIRAVVKRREGLLRAARRYDEHCRLNVMSMWTPRSLYAFVASMYAQTSAANAKNTVGHLQKLYRLVRDPVPVTLGDLRAILSKEQAQKIRRQSPDFKSLAQAYQVAAAMAAPARGVALMMLTLGPRYQDLTRLSGGDLDVRADPRWVAVNLTMTKNRRTAKDRKTVRLGPADLKHVPAGAWREVVQNASRHSLTGGVTWTQLAEELRFAAATVGHQSVDGRPLTPGSLRRAFVQRTIRNWTAVKDGRQITDWDAVIERTGHCDKKTVQAYYDTTKIIA